MTVPGRSGVRAEHGVALLSALLTVALLTVIVIEMTDATMVHTHLSRNAGNAIAAQLLARSAATAGEALVGNDTTNPPDPTCDRNLWAAPFPNVPAGSGMMFLQITDEGGKLDLNQVRNQAYAQAVQKLFSSLDIDPSLVDRIAAWVAPPADGAMATGGASDYCALSMPCAPRQQPLNSLDELLLIRGFDEQAVARLRPYATAIPRLDARGTGAPVPVNAITAKPLVLAALGCEGNAEVPACPTSVGGSGDEKTTDWKKKYTDWQTKNCSAAQKLLGTKSTFFAIDATGVVGDMAQSLRVLVQRSGKNVKRLSWQERPVSDTLPSEVR
jgi:general secretion pathway protein K